MFLKNIRPYGKFKLLKPHRFKEKNNYIPVERGKRRKPAASGTLINDHRTNLYLGSYN